ncbi:MAG: DUF928 domain-containing protein [Thiohalobacterales bacterium]|nr:DUF928 domain-containing protein [Thiohalobacterales bacterium]
MKTEYVKYGLSAMLALAIAHGHVHAASHGDETAAGKGAAGEQVADQEREDTKDAVADKAPPAMPVYVPPMRGAPVARVGGGTRGIDDELPYVSVVTPEHTGYTSSAQPVLYWYLSEPVDTRFEFALINDNEIEPIMEIATERQMQEGLNYLDLAEHGVSLKPGIIYQWSVALVGQPEKRSSDIVSSGTIELVELSAEQPAALAGADAEGAVTIFAREGYWYDAFTGLSRLIDASPANAGLRAQRTALLRQVGLDEVAEAGK